MKKTIILFCLLASSTVSFAQGIDSLTYIEEMQRLSRVSDSLKNVQIAKDSLSLEEIIAIQKAQNVTEENESDAEKRFNEFMQRQDKEQHTLRNRLLLLVAFFLILLLSMRAILIRQKQRKKKSNNL